MPHSSPWLPLNTSRCLVIHQTQSSLSFMDDLQQTTICLLSLQKAEAACFSRYAPTPTTWDVMSQPSEVGVLIHGPRKKERTHPSSAPWRSTPGRALAFSLASRALAVSEVVLAPLCGHWKFYKCTHTPLIRASFRFPSHCTLHTRILPCNPFKPPLLLPPFTLVEFVNAVTVPINNKWK